MDQITPAGGIQPADEEAEEATKDHNTFRLKKSMW
jgi:hypothetical protein